MKPILIITLILFTLTSCVSEKELLTKIDFKNVKTNIEIKNDFLNKNINDNTYKDLIQILNYHNIPKIFKNYDRYNDSSIVNIVFDGINNLNVSYKDTSNTLVNYNLKVKNKGNYLSLKRKFTFIPIPVLFTYYWNEKTIIYVDNQENLNLISGQSQFVWILITGGDRKVYENKFELIKK
jgi:hypothetical protein